MSFRPFCECVTNQGECAAKAQEAPAELLNVNPIFNVWWVASSYKTVHMVWWLCTAFRGCFTSGFKSDECENTARMSVRKHCEALGEAINQDLSLSGGWREGCFEKALSVTPACRAKPGSEASKQCHMAGKPDWDRKPGRKAQGSVKPACRHMLKEWVATLQWKWHRPCPAGLWLRWCWVTQNAIEHLARTMGKAACLHPKTPFPVFLKCPVPLGRDGGGQCHRCHHREALGWVQAWPAQCQGPVVLRHQGSWLW